MKRRIDRVCIWGFVCAFLALAAAKSSALDFSFTGTFTKDNDVALFTFTVGPASSDVTLKSLSYGGGVNAAGQTIPRGGFDPLLAVFDSSGTLIATNDDGGAFVPPDPNNGLHFDVYLRTNLSAGTYTAALSQYDNAAIGPTLLDGFAEDGDENFTQKFSGGKPGFFYDATGNQRNGDWALDLLMKTPSVPDEGLSLVLLSLGIFSLIWARLGTGSSPALS